MSLGNTSLGTFLASEVPTQLLMIKGGILTVGYGGVQLANGIASFKDGYIKEGESVFGKGNYAFNGALEGSRPFLKYFTSFTTVGTVNDILGVAFGNDLTNINFDRGGNLNLGDSVPKSERWVKGVLLGGEVKYGLGLLIDKSSDIYHAPLQKIYNSYNDINDLYGAGTTFQSFTPQENNSSEEYQENEPH